MEKKNNLDSFCNKCQSNAVTNEKIKRSFEFICYLEDLINSGGGGDLGITTLDFDENTNILKATFSDGSVRETSIPLGNFDNLFLKT